MSFVFHFRKSLVLRRPLRPENHSFCALTPGDAERVISGGNHSFCVARCALAHVGAPRVPSTMSAPYPGSCEIPDTFHHVPTAVPRRGPSPSGCPCRNCQNTGPGNRKPSDLAFTVLLHSFWQRDESRFLSFRMSGKMRPENASVLHKNTTRPASSSLSRASTRPASSSPASKAPPSSGFFTTKCATPQPIAAKSIVPKIALGALLSTFGVPILFAAYVASADTPIFPSEWTRPNSSGNRCKCLTPSVDFRPTRYAKIR